MEVNVYDDYGNEHPAQNTEGRDRDQTSIRSRNRDVTWITTSQFPSRNLSTIPGTQPPLIVGPSRPLPVPNPPRAFVPSEELDAEYMTVDPEEDFGGWNGERDFQSQWRKPGPKDFVGGFVNGLRRIPRVVRLRPTRKGTGDTVGTGDTLPKYQSPVLVGPSEPDVLYVEASEMPVEHPAPAPVEFRSRQSDGHSYRSHLDDGRSRHSHHTPADAVSHHTDSRSHHTHADVSYHTDNRSHHTHADVSHLTDGRSHHTHPDAVSYHTYVDGHSHHTDHRSHHTSVGHEHTFDTHTTAHSTHSHAPHEYETRETTLGHVPVPIAALSPEAVDLRPSSDYDKMESPLRSPSELSLHSRFARVGQFFQDLYDLPWIASRITVDYIPAEQSRAKYGRRIRTTWYPHQHSPIDLFAGDRPTPPRRVDQVRDRNNDDEYIPNSSATLAYPNGRADIRSRSPSYDQHRSRSPPHSRLPPGAHPVYPRGYAPEYAPQPLYIYPSTIPQAQPPGGIQSSSTNVVDQGQTQPEMQQARPVYIMAPSPPHPFMPTPPDQVHAPPGAYYPYPVSHNLAAYPA